MNECGIKSKEGLLAQSFHSPIAHATDTSYANNYPCIIITTYLLTKLWIKVSSENFTIHSYLRFLKFILIQKL